jgi:hypothetical protein
LGQATHGPCDQTVGGKHEANPVDPKQFVELHRIDSKHATMLSSSLIADILELMTELEVRVHADPKLEAEWIGELERDPAALGQTQALSRFREWFLLERDSEALGTSPLLAWSPAELVADSAWVRLLDNFLGIFKIAGTRRSEGREFLDVLDLWSGRIAHLPVDVLAGGPGEDGDMLFVGRLVLADDEVHLPLPGMRLAHAPGLVKAVESDLALARHHQPRARLSQRECDALFTAIPSGESAELESTESIAELLAQLDEVLQDAPGWDWERIQASLDQHGPTGTLDRLAFETVADLESLRRILPALASQTPAETKQASKEADDLESAKASEAAQALDVYDLARDQGLSVEQAFRKLEEALGLEPGTSEELLPDQLRDNLPVGPEQVAGLDAWIETYLWEQRAEPSGAPSPEIEATLRAFAKQAQAAAGKTIDAQELSPVQVLPYLMAATSTEEFLARRSGLLGFLVWATQEQGAALGSALNDWACEEDQRLPAMVEANRVMRDAGADWRNRQLLHEVSPPSVQAEGGDSAPVTGLPNEVEACLRVGDLVLGVWRMGRFQAAALVPKEAIPTQVEQGGEVQDDDADAVS